MTQPSRPSKATVIVIDDDEGVREALQGLLESVGLYVEVFGSVQEFLDAKRPASPGCMILDIRLPGQSGLEFQEALAQSESTSPIILISAYADVPMSVRAMKAGAIEVLTKPVREQELLEAVQRAIEQDSARRSNAQVRALIKARFGKLTERERQVMAFVVTGMQNKQIAAAMAVTEATVKLHRGQVMRKMEAGSVVELVRMADGLGQSQAKPTGTSTRV
ncbi:response regulator [Mesorhizobium sp. M0074]|uniref:response regulator transcription factor n=1 Tax=Mesorhizobium sp. M0074 TaxID=2956869 RepID=UPI00333BE18D